MSHNPPKTQEEILKFTKELSERMAKLYKPRDPGRIPILLSLLGEYWQRPGYNDLRLTQLLMNLMGEIPPAYVDCLGPVDSSGSYVYNFEDDEVIAALREVLNCDRA